MTASSLSSSEDQSFREEISFDKPQQGTGNLPDWLDSIRDDNIFSDETDNEPLPDWVTGRLKDPFESRDHAEPLEVPDWLSTLRQEGEKVQTSALSEDKLNQAPIDEEPDWLRKLRVGQDVQSPPPRRIKEPPVSEQPPVTFGESPPATQVVGEASDEIPDWVAELSGKPSIAEEKPVSSSERDSSQDEGQFAQKEEEGSLLAWLSSLEGDAAPIEPSTVAQSVAEQPLEDQDDEFSTELSGLFDDVEAESFDQQIASILAEDEDEEKELASEAVSPFTSEDEFEDLGELPDWIGGLTTEETSETLVEEPEVIEEEIAPTPVPEWLEAFRPEEEIEKSAEAILQRPLDKKVEGAGPLAGLYSVLPAEPDIALSRKATIKTDDLLVTEKQRHHTSILEALLSSEGSSETPGEKILVTPQNIFRIVVFVLLCLVIIGASLTGFSVGTVPSPSSGVLDTIDSINSMSSGSPVLIAVDYQPGYTGEMEASTSVLLDHLMVNGAYMAMVSTNPSGPAQIERLVSQVNQEKNHQYKAKEQYIALGYIPGGVTGLNGFATQPRRMFNMGADGKPIWESSWLSNINKISDFALVIVATDDPDTARAWIEQVQPYLGNTPLLMSVSAQAEPLVRPYYDSQPKQVNGLVAGLLGGATYEQIINRSGVAVKYWSPFTTVILLAIVVLLIGSAYSIITMLSSQRKEKAQEGQG